MAEQKTVEEIVRTSFLARVPAFLEAGHAMDEAIKLAYDQEEAFLLEMQIGTSERSKLAHEVLNHKVYETINRQESERKLMRRLEQIAK